LPRDLWWPVSFASYFESFFLQRVAAAFFARAVR